MAARRLILALMTAALLTPIGWARYARPQLEQTPIDRLIANLEDAVKKTPKDTTVRHALARTYAMAYASKAEQVEVKKGELSPWFGFEPPHVPFQVQPTEDKDKKLTAAKYLQKAVATYESLLKMEPDNLTIALGHAWCVEQAGSKSAAIKTYRAVIAQAWKKEKDLTVAGLGWHSVTVEAGQYLTPLLDKEADKAEIEELKVRAEKMSKVMRPITPIAVPLKAGMTLEQVENRKASVAFDADGSGLQRRWSWISRDAAWLVYDAKKTGRITSALQMFGSVTFWCFWENGYQALATLDDNGDGQLTGNELAGLALWHDANGNGVSDPDEVKPLTEHGIVALSCRYQIDRAAWSKAGVTLKDGTSRPTFDVVLERR